MKDLYYLSSYLAPSFPFSIPLYNCQLFCHQNLHDEEASAETFQFQLKGRAILCTKASTLASFGPMKVSTWMPQTNQQFEWFVFFWCSPCPHPKCPQSLLTASSSKLKTILLPISKWGKHEMKLFTSRA